MKKYLDFYILFGLVCHILSEQCIKLRSRNCDCECKSRTGRKYIISLEAYTEKSFLDIANAEKTDFFSYNPCSPIPHSASCSTGANTSAAVWQRTVKDNACYYTGDFKDSEFHGDPEKADFRIDYTGQDQRRTGVKLVCSKETRLEVIGEKLKNTYNLTLHTPFVCVSSDVNDVGGGLSAGSILLIVFLVLVMVYLGGGVLVLRLKHGARGVEMIPNYDFWVEFPLLVKDGLEFVSRGCKTEPSYQQI